MDGLVVINKEKTYTSHDVVAIVKKILNEGKVGHTGTLDPNATGVLPILLGKGTKLSKYLINHDKTYEVVLRLGQKTDTADSEGNIIEEKEVLTNYITNENVERVLEYSAIKVNGKKLYEYARKGQTVEIKPREIEIYSIKLLSIKNYNSNSAEFKIADEQKNINQIEINFTVSCSKGTYIRSLCENIAEKLNTVRLYERT